jgi:endonuclease/exonuclease/phosphatase family metal-dependent hydrolase
MKILSWNILADEFIKQTYYPMIPSHILLNRKKRQDRIIETLKQANADIMLLQEVMQSEYNKLDDEFNKTYHLIKGKHIYWNEKRSYSGNIILLRKSLFSFPNNQVDLSFGLAVQVHLKHSEMPILVINIHLDDLSQANRLREIKTLEPLLFSQQRIILGGDLNEHYNPTHLTKLYKSLEENYFTMTNHQPTYYIKSKISIDHILLKGFETHTKTSKVINEFGANVVEHFTNYGSDHLPVTVIL